MSSQAGQIVVERLTDPTDAETDACMELYVEAFKDEKIVNLGGSDRATHKAAHRPRFDQALTEGEVWIARVPGTDGVIGCVACVFPPTQNESLHAGPPPTADQFLGPAERQWQEEVVQPHRARGNASIPGGRKSAYYIRVLATHPAYQGQGLGSAVIQHVVQLGKTHGWKVALTAFSESAAKVYRRNGFREIYSAEITYLDGEKGPYYTLVRDA